MICKNLAYWVFTSGEEGVHGLDWGIKHASKSFADRYKLDSRYRSLLEDFSLSPSLEQEREQERERPKKAGLILLPWQGGEKDRDEETLMGFIFPGSDHKGRPNISTVACVVPADVVRALTPSHVTRALWSSNDLERIARKNSEKPGVSPEGKEGSDERIAQKDFVRPDTLYLDEEKASSATEVPFPLSSSLKWPKKDVGYLMIDGVVRDLSVKKRNLPTPQLAALLMALALTFGVACCWGSIRDFSQKYLIQPVCSWWSGGDPSPSTNSPEDPETTERREKRREKREAIIDILSKNKGEDYLKGLAGLMWVPEPWKEKASLVDFLIVEAISENFTVKLKNEKWLVEKGDQGGRGGQEKKLINVSVFKENFKITVLSPLGKDFSSVVDETDRGEFFSISPKKAGIEAWGSLKKGLNDQLSQFIDMTKNPGVSLESATQPIAEDRRTLEERLDELLEKSDTHKDKGFGCLSFFYGDGKEGYQVLLLNMEDLSEGKKLDKYIFVKKDNWRRIDVSDLGKHLDGTLQKKPYIKFDDDRRDITFFLAPKSKREKGGDFKEFLDVFFDDLLKSVLVEE